MMVTRSHITHTLPFLLGIYISISCTLFLLHTQSRCHGNFEGHGYNPSTARVESRTRSKGEVLAADGRKVAGGSANESTVDGHNPSIGRLGSRAKSRGEVSVVGGWKVAGGSANESTIEFSSNFTFPSSQMRLKYYMGDWFNRTVSPKDIPCNEIKAMDKIVSDKPVLWRASKMKHEIQNNRAKNWLIGPYLVDAYNVMNSTGIDHEKGDDRYLILHIGDSHSHSTKLPTVAKTRFSRFATAKGSGKPFFESIIFPLRLFRHYEPIEEYIKLHKEGKVCRWKDKQPALIWRGGVTGVKGNLDKSLLATYVNGGSRMKVVKEYFSKNISNVDVAFEKGHPTVPKNKKDASAQLVRGSHTSMIDQLKYKYILSIEGNDVASGLKWQLVSDSVVFMARPTTVSFLMEDQLVPFMHYVPLKDDYSNLIDMVHWARENDKQCNWISEQATLFMEQLWTNEEAKRENAAIIKELGETYHRQFGEAIKSCDHGR